MNEVHALMDADNSEMEQRLKQVMDELSAGCNKYVTISKASTSGPGTGKTKLDKEHLKLCQREMVAFNINIKLHFDLM